MQQEKRQRKERSDKGSVMATRRDLYCITWLAEMYAARSDQIQRLLSRFPDKRRPFKDGSRIAETTLKDQLSRWKRAGWIEYRRVLADSPGWAWVTRRGLALVDLDEIYTARAPAYTRLDHIYAVNQVRLWMDGRYLWKSERRYRSEMEKATKGEKSGPVPDALIMTKDSAVVALEIEISPKKPADLELKMVRLVRHIVSDGLGYKSAFPRIWFYVPSESMKGLVESAIEGLRDDEQGRVSVGVEADLIASRIK